MMTIPRIRILLLGSFQVTLDAAPVAFATDKVRALLAYLAVEGDRPHSREALAGLLWPDQPETRARHSLRQALTLLRQPLAGAADDEALLLAKGETIRLNPAVYYLDVVAFDSLIRACRHHRHTRLTSCLPCLRRLEQAAELYRGPLLQGFSLRDSESFEEWLISRREWLQQQAVEALASLSTLWERRGDLGRAKAYVWRQVELEPWYEEAHAQLMRLLALGGRRSAALAQYQTCQRVLTAELGVEPSAETVALYERIRAGALTPPESLSRLLTPSTPLVGREAEASELAEHLADPARRLVTLIGPGGIGKTRLALQLAIDHVGLYPDGVWFIPLAEAGSEAEIVSAMAGALGLAFGAGQTPREQLLSHLESKEMLWVLDSLEHLGESREFVGEVLRHSPGLTILATSRERLGLYDEWVYELGGLAFPSQEAEESLESYAALDLFQQRARQVQRGFTLSGEEGAAAARICRLVEGLPLAVELAASGVALRPCVEIAEDLERDLGTLASTLHDLSQRQESIWATFEASWRLLTPTEQRVFANLSVFHGGFTGEAAEQVAGASAAVLTGLVLKSMVRCSSSLYEVHALLQRYGAAKLATDTAARVSAELAHARYFASFLQKQSKRLSGSEAKAALAAITAQIDNIRQAWFTAVANDWVETAEQSLPGLYDYHHIQSRYQEGITLLAPAVARWSSEQAHASLVARTEARLGVLYQHLGKVERADECLKASLATAERLHLLSEQVFCLAHLAELWTHSGHNEEVERLAQRALALARESGTPDEIAHCLAVMGLLQIRTGRLAEAETALAEGLALVRQGGDVYLMQTLLSALGDLVCYWGDYATAETHFSEGLALSRELGNALSAGMHLNNLGTVQHVQGRYEAARSLYQESLDQCRQVGDLRGQALALANLGEVALAMGMRHEALEACLAGVQIGQRIQNSWITMACLNNLGELEIRQGDLQHAADHLLQALDIALQGPAPAVLLKILSNGALFFAALGETERPTALLHLVRWHSAGEPATRERAEELLTELGLTNLEAPLLGLEEAADEMHAELQRLARKADDR